MEQPPVASWRGSFTSGVSGFEQSTIVLNSRRNKCIFINKAWRSVSKRLFELMGDNYAGISIKHGERLRRNSSDARNRRNRSGGGLLGLHLTVRSRHREIHIALDTDRREQNDQQKRGAESTKNRQDGPKSNSTTRSSSNLIGLPKGV